MDSGLEKSSNDKEDSGRVIPYANAKKPSCTEDRDKGAEPQLQKSEVGRMKPSRIKPKTNSNNSGLTGLLADKTDPELPRSSDDKDGSKLHKP